MQSTVLMCFAALVACPYAQTYRLPEIEENKWLEDMHIERTVGKVFRILGHKGDILFDRGGRNVLIFDRFGQLIGQMYGDGVAVDIGDNSVLGSKFKWINANDNVRAAPDVYKEVGTGSDETLTGDSVWKVDKNTKLVAGGNLEKSFGHDKPQVGFEPKIEYDLSSV